MAAISVQARVRRFRQDAQTSCGHSDHNLQGRDRESANTELPATERFSARIVAGEYTMAIPA